MKLTDEQRDEIQEALETQGGIYSEYGMQKIRKNGIEWLQSLLKSEQAWKEESQMGYENYDRIHGQLTRAVEVLRETKNRIALMQDTSESPAFRHNAGNFSMYKIDEFLSSLSQEGGNHASND